MMIGCSEMRTDGTRRDVVAPSVACSPAHTHFNGDHASSNERITKSSEQRLNNNVIQRRREKCLAFESSQASPDAHQHQLSLKIDIEVSFLWRHTISQWDFFTEC